MPNKLILVAILIAISQVACASTQSKRSETKTEATPAKADNPVIVADVGFATPESVLHDTAADLYLVSNINGSPFGVDDNGFISRVSPDGTVADLKWIDGASEEVTLNAPKGLGIANGTLYVADIDHVRMFDAATGAAKGAVKIEGATFLNDIATGPDGAVYVSDSGFGEGFTPSGTDAIYAVAADGTTSVVAKGESLGHPNGLLITSAGLTVVTFGSGEVYSVSAGAERTAGVKPEKGSLDGVVVLDGGELLISSWAAEGVYRGPASGPFTQVATGLTAPADIGFDRKRGRLLVPMFKTNAVQIHTL
ncbi:MAG: SMP-30/gluconolactonase/LRE family protein [Myxococcota bacterium]|nr:SMP-30/gluconolactonase/LRE family protein [Myxococcota bacterium]